MKFSLKTTEIPRNSGKNGYKPIMPDEAFQLIKGALSLCKSMLFGELSAALRSFRHVFTLRRFYFV